MTIFELAVIYIYTQNILNRSLKGEREIEGEREREGERGRERELERESELLKVKIIGLWACFRSYTKMSYRLFQTPKKPKGYVGQSKGKLQNDKQFLRT